MITSRHKKAIKNLGKYRTEGEAFVKAGYTESYARSGIIKHTQGWKDILAKALPDEKLAKRHKELLEKNDEHGEPETQAVSKALDMAYKLKGSYAPEKTVNVNVEPEHNPKVDALAEKLNELLKGGSVGGDGVEAGTLGIEAPDKE